MEQTPVQSNGPAVNKNLKLKRKEIQCDTCIHLLRGPGRCEAFPRGIPKDILTGKVDHTTPFTGDKGITYTKKPEKENLPEE